MASRRALAWSLLVLALVLAQAIGFAHRVVHGPQARLAAVQVNGLQWQAQARHVHGHAHAGGHADADTHAHVRAAGGWIADLFAGHDDDSSCRLFDPLQHDGPAPVPLLVLPLAPCSVLLARSQGEFLARFAALFDARGPPFLR